MTYNYFLKIGFPKSVQLLSSTECAYVCVYLYVQKSRL